MRTIIHPITGESDDDELVYLNQASHSRVRKPVMKKTRISSNKTLGGSSAEDVEADAMLDEVGDKGNTTGYRSASAGERGNTEEIADQIIENMGFGEDN